MVRQFIISTCLAAMTAATAFGSVSNTAAQVSEAGMPPNDDAVKQPQADSSLVKSKEPSPQLADRSAPTKVYSCAIHFPLDSVRFDIASMDQCFAEISIDRISYIHVIATATPDGSNKHNLYLSTRRAGSIEGFLRNKYPDIEIHAFGGGENPKFGKMARIIIVESALDPRADKSGPEKVVDTTPPKIISKLVYRDVPRRNLGIALEMATGVARFNPTNDNYQFVSGEAGYALPNPWVKNVTVGARYGLKRADLRRDVHSFDVFAAKKYSLGSVYNIGLSASGRIFSGLAFTNSAAVDMAASTIFQAEKKNFMSAIEVGYGRHFLWVGLSVGSVI